MTDEKPYIVVIDDNQADLELFSEAILDMGAQVICRTAKAADEGLELIDRCLQPGNSPPSVIVLDLRMPGHDGMYLLRHLQESREPHGIPVVVLTSSNWQKDRAECLRLGASHYRVKPQDWNGYKELVEFLRQFFLRD
jgi:CheY-like chemotaxis protein